MGLHRVLADIESIRYLLITGTFGKFGQDLTLSQGDLGETALVLMAFFTFGEDIVRNNLAREPEFTSQNRTQALYQMLLRVIVVKDTPDAVVKRLLLDSLIRIDIEQHWMTTSLTDRLTETVVSLEQRNIRHARVDDEN
jgi:hypothetical protein